MQFILVNEHYKNYLAISEVRGEGGGWLSDSKNGLLFVSCYYSILIATFKLPSWSRASDGIKDPFTF
jgi:hypothetical protein